MNKIILRTHYPLVGDDLCVVPFCRTNLQHCRGRVSRPAIPHPLRIRRGRPVCRPAMCVIYRCQRADTQVGPYTHLMISPFFFNRRLCRHLNFAFCILHFAFYKMHFAFKKATGNPVAFSHIFPLMAVISKSPATTRSSGSKPDSKLSEYSTWALGGNSSSPAHTKICI